MRTRLDRDNPLQVGNGEFAFNVDITGLQSVIPFNTLAQWAWHSAPLPDGKQPDDYPWVEWEHGAGAKPYCSRVDINDPMFVWRFTNPHKINLGRIALRMSGSESCIKEEDIKNARQELDLWTGQITSVFEINEKPVRVETVCHPDHDMIAVRVVSPLLQSGEMGVEISFPGARNHTFDWVQVEHLIGDWTLDSSEHVTIARQRDGKRVDFARFLDDSEHHVSLCWETEESIFATEGAHRFTLSPTPGTSEALAFTVAFSSDPISNDLQQVAETVQSSARYWHSFWSNGGAVDLSNSRDPRWKELERRIVLSQYLMAVNVAGSLPPQESGLLLNTWYGKFHMEMTWWHAAHFALWNRMELFRHTLCWYKTLLSEARKIAERQGYPGVRWPKMAGPEGREAPNDVNPLLIWQQPHPIFFAELEWRANPTADTLERWKEIVSETGAFMAAFPVWNQDSSHYDLAPPLCTVSENTDKTRVLNPTFELTYWRFGLAVAQQWRERLGLERNPDWDRVLERLAPIATQDGVYLLEEGLPDTYTAYNWEHPALAGCLGMLPGHGVDRDTMSRTFSAISETWQMDRVWGWDFPLLAMCAARSNEPQHAIEYLLHPSPSFQFKDNGVTGGWLGAYFPSNGGLLYAVAMLCAGWDGSGSQTSPGFPADGSWDVRWEGLSRAL